MDALILFCLTALLILPLFRIEYFNNWMSIEGSFIGDARYIAEQWPHPSWHALWYCGTRFDYIYPPATRYGAAIASMLLNVSPARGYHIFIALMYCLGIAGVYFLARTGSGSRRMAWTAACAYAVISPEFAFLGQYRTDSLQAMPERLNTLIKWGEGPHASALAVIPWAIGFSFLALKGQRQWAVPAAAFCSALVVSNNLYGAVALAIFYAVFVWSIAITGGGHGFWLRAAAIPALAAGLCAWWLTPSYLLLTERNLALVALPGNSWSAVLGLVLAAAFAAGSWWAARRFAAPAWGIFVAGCTLAFTVEVLGQFWFHFRLWGEPMRFVIELDMVLVLAIAEVLRRIHVSKPWLAGGLTLVMFGLAGPYLSSPWSVYLPDLHWRNRIEYRLTEWLTREMPGARVFTTGSVSFWQSAWSDLAQAGGGSDQGMQNLMPAISRYQIMFGDKADRDILWLQALGADALVVNGPKSQEIFHAVTKPEKYDGRLPVIYQQDGDTVYRVPRHPGLARVVDEQVMARLPAIPVSNDDSAQLKAYVDAMETAQTLAPTKRSSPGKIDIAAVTGPGQSVAVQESFDPGWNAWIDGKPAPVMEDVMHFMRVRTSPGDHKIRFVYSSTIEVRAGRWVSVATLLLLGAICLRTRNQ